MKVTRDVILDLWPAYQAGEVSTETRALVDEYLASDPEFASILRKIGDARRLLHDSRATADARRERQAVQAARARVYGQWVLLAAAVAMTLLVVLAGLDFFFALLSPSHVLTPAHGILAGGLSRLLFVSFLMMGLVAATLVLWWGFSRLVKG